MLKINNNLRYATDAAGAGVFVLACAQAGVPVQTFRHALRPPLRLHRRPAHRGGDRRHHGGFGAPMLSMHSAREVCGVDDQAMYVAALTAFLAPA